MDENASELSGQIFPFMQEEQERLQEEECQFLAEYEARRAEATQERDTEPLLMTILQEA